MRIRIMAITIREEFCTCDGREVRIEMLQECDFMCDGHSFVRIMTFALLSDNFILSGVLLDRHDLLNHDVWYEIFLGVSLLLKYYLDLD